MVTKNLIRDLLVIGESQENNLYGLRSAYPDLATADHLNRLALGEWWKVTQELNNDDLIRLVKGLTIAEREFNWSGGSVAAVIWVFKKLQERDPGSAEQVGDWVRQQTRNEYAPSGAARWPHSYRTSEHLADYLTHRSRILENESRRLEEAGVRRAQRQTASSARAQAQRSRCVAGVDGCKDGWIVVIADPDGSTREIGRAHV